MTTTRSSTKTVQAEVLHISKKELQDIISNAINVSTEKLLMEMQLLKSEIQQLKDIQYGIRNERNVNIENIVNDNTADRDSSLHVSVLSPDTIVDNTKTQTGPIEQQTKIVKQPPKIRKRNDQHKQRSIASTYAGVVGTKSNTTGQLMSNSKLWIYVGRCKAESTAEDVKSYLELNSPGHKFEVEKLESKGKNTSYKVEADLSLKEELYSSTYWPVGILIKRFRFQTTTKRPF